MPIIITAPRIIAPVSGGSPIGGSPTGGSPIGGSPLSFAKYFQVARSTAPGGYWKLDETGGSPITVIDEIGINNGIQTNAPTVGEIGIDGDTGTSYKNTSATSQRVRIPVALWDGTGDFSMSIWIKTTESGRSMTFIDRHVVGTTFDNRLSCILNRDQTDSYSVNKITIYTRSTSNFFVATTSAVSGLTDGNWHQIVVGRSGSSAFIYVDGDSKALTGSIYSGDVNNGEDYLFGGVGYTFVESSFWFNGSYDEPKFYNFALTPTDVKRLYLVGTGYDDTYETLSLAQSPGGYWKLDETSGSILDSSGNGNNGSEVGTLTRGETSLVTADPGKAISGFSASDYITVSNDATISPTSSFTVTYWFQTSSSGNNTAMDKRDLFSPAVQGFLTGVRGDKVRAYIKNASSVTTEVIGNKTVSDGLVHFASCVYDDDTDLISVYVDGEFDNSGAFAGTYATVAVSDALYIGRNGPTSTWTYFDGTLDEVKYIERALSAEEIADEYAMGKHGPNTYAYIAHRMNPVAYWRLEEVGSPVTAQDETGKMYDGTYNNSPTLGDPGLITDGGNSVGFNGSTQFVTVPNTAKLGGKSNHSVSFWCKPTIVDGTARHVYSENDSGGNIVFAVGIGASNTFVHVIINSGTFVATGTTTPVVGETYHVVATLDSTNGMSLYVNGVLEDTDPNTNTIPSSITQIRIGCVLSASTEVFFFGGNIDELSTYDKTLSAAEVKMLYDKGKNIF